MADKRDDESPGEHMMLLVVPSNVPAQKPIFTSLVGCAAQGSQS